MPGSMRTTQRCTRAVHGAQPDTLRREGEGAVVAERPTEAVLRAQERAAAGMRHAWDLLLKATAASPVPGAAAAVEGAQQAVTALTVVASTAAQPLLALVAGQRELADQLDRWAQLQRETADVLGALATQQRLTADLLAVAVGPWIGPRGDDPPPA